MFVEEETAGSSGVRDDGSRYVVILVVVLIRQQAGMTNFSGRYDTN